MVQRCRQHVADVPLQPAADLAFASRVFTLITTGQEDARQLEILFSPFAALDRYVQRRPDDSTALHLFGLLCERLGQLPLAISMVERAAAALEDLYNREEDPAVERRYAIAQANLARLWLAGNDNAKAKAASDVVLSLLQAGSGDDTVDVIRGQALYCSGVSSFLDGDLTTSISVLEGALSELSDSLADVRSRIGIALAQTLWSLGGEDAREAAKNQLLNA